ncbi:MAG: hypothetical protein HY863_04915 [Chloroflexi bacterium]|nr:hypothetical protein [Chloroflexota bacterium]
MANSLGAKENYLSNTPRKQLLWMSELLAFFVGLLSAVYINVGGNLYLAEILLLLLLPYLLYSRRSLLRFGYVKLILLFGLSWFINQIITDVYRGTSLNDILKGWALIAIFLTDFVALYMFVFPEPRLIALSLLGHAIGLMLQMAVQPNGNMLADSWKFGTGHAGILFASVIIFFLYKKNPGRVAWWAIVLAMLAVYSFYVRSRALGGVAMLSAFVVWFRFTRIGRGLAQRINNPVNLTMIILLLFTAIGGIVQGYGYMVEQGYLGDVARNLYLTQSSGEYGILLGGRREWLPATHAILDSPIIGYGSYARNTEYGQYLYELADLGYVVNNAQLEIYLATRNFIPTHSHLLQGWVWAGLAGGIFWLFILVLIIRTMIMAYRYPSALFTVTIFLGFYAIWSVLFSPLSNVGRLQWAYALVTFLYALGVHPELTRGNRKLPSYSANKL